MPEKKTMRRARQKAREGKAPSTQAGEFVREEMHHVKEGKHEARSRKQVIAIGLAKARRTGVRLPAPRKGSVSEKTRQAAQRSYEVGQGMRQPRKSSPKQRKAREEAMKREPRTVVSQRALSKHAKIARRKRM